MGDTVDSSLKFTTLDVNSWSVDSGFGAQHYHDGDSAQSKEGAGYDYESWMQAIVDSDTAETLKFWWKAELFHASSSLTASKQSRYSTGRAPQLTCQIAR
jgi:hypothetical protein